MSHRSTPATYFAFVVLCLSMLPSAVMGQPGDIITIEASCTYQLDGQAEPLSETSSSMMVILSPLALGHPVYLAQGWSKANKLASGIQVRAFVWIDGLVTLADGIQLSDGRVWIDGQARDRVDLSSQIPISTLPGFAASSLGNNWHIAGEHTALGPLSHPKAVK